MSTVLGALQADPLTNALVDLAIAMRQTATAASTNRPRPLNRPASAVADSAGNALLVFDACPVGRFWSLQRLVIGGATWDTAAAGTAVAFLTSSPPSSPDAAVPLGLVFDQADELPLVAFYGARGHQVPIAQREALCVQVTGGTSGQQYVATAQLDDYPL